jgi:DNA-binding XRE family transcriptional regulator
MDHIKENVKRLREARNLSQADLAQSIGVAQSTISMIERGERLPSWDLAIELTMFFGVSLDELVRSGEPVNA